MDASTPPPLPWPDFDNPAHRGEFMAGVENFACLFFVDLLSAFEFETLADLGRFLNYWTKVVGPSVRERYNRPDIKTLSRDRIAFLQGVYYHDRRTFMSIARKAQEEYRERAAKEARL